MMTLIKKIYQKVKYKLEAKLKIYYFRQNILKYKKVTGNHQYSVVSAVYNIEKYLDDYFRSIVDQTLIFKKHIHLKTYQKAHLALMVLSHGTG